MGQDSSQLKSTAFQQPENTSKAVARDAAATALDPPDALIAEDSQYPPQDASAKVDNNVAASARKRSFLKKKQSTVHTTTKAIANGKSAIPVTSTSTGKQDDIAASSQLLQEASASSLKPQPSASTLKDKAKIYDGHSRFTSDDSGKQISHFCVAFVGISASSINSYQDSLSPNSSPEEESLTSKRHPSPFEPLFVPEDAPPPKAPRRKRRMPVFADSVRSPAQPQVKKPKTSRKLGANRREDHRSAEDIEKHGGVFTHEEVATFEAWKDGCCNAFELTKGELRDCLLQKSHKHNKDLHALFEDLYGTFPNRKQDAVRKFARRQVSEKRGADWKPHEDATIRSMMNQVPKPTYQQIGREINRFEEDVRNRWRDKLAPGAADASKGHWQASEKQALYRAYARCVLKVCHCEPRRCFDNYKLTLVAGRSGHLATGRQ